jgi:hypothetical protein
MPCGESARRLVGPIGDYMTIRRLDVWRMQVLCTKIALTSSFACLLAPYFLLSGPRLEDSQKGYSNFPQHLCSASQNIAPMNWRYRLCSEQRTHLWTRPSGSRRKGMRPHPLTSRDLCITNGPGMQPNPYPASHPRCHIGAHLPGCIYLFPKARGRSPVRGRLFF